MFTAPLSWRFLCESWDVDVGQEESVKVPAATTTLETQSIDASTGDITKEVSA